jgi:hypothetical protein
MGRRDEPLDLARIPHELHATARRAFARGDIERSLGYASNEVWLDILHANVEVIRKRGMYERALFNAFVSTRTNHHNLPLSYLRHLFKSANRKRLLELGNPLPGPGPFTVYRGVAGCRSARHVRGLSWTSSPEQAAWFALRYRRLADPAVYEARISEQAVMVYTNDRNEREFIVLLPRTVRLVRLEGVP